MTPPPLGGNSPQGLAAAWLARLEERVPRGRLLWIITAILLLGAIASGAAGVYGPWQQRKHQLELRFAEEQQRSELLSTIDLQNRQIKGQEEKILLQGGPTVLTREVTRVASKTNFQIESVAPRPDLSFGPYTRYQIQVVATAHYLDVLRFLQAIERQEPLLKVEHCEVGTPLQETRPYGSYGRAGSAPVQPISLEGSRQKVTLLISTFSRRGGGTAP